nr:unnamed protein product [Callosobruchus chinensis]
MITKDLGMRRVEQKQCRVSIAQEPNLLHRVITENNAVMMPQPPYLPDLAPCDFSLFPKLKRSMKGRRNATTEDKKTTSPLTDVLS